MAKKRNPSKRTRFPLSSALITIGALVILLPLSGFAFAANQESQDAFCASCHTQPESSYFQRSIDAQPLDLASDHKIEKTRCIDCHSGKGMFGRMQAELLGARNALTWVTNTAVQPAKLTFPIRDSNCLKCHPDVTQENYVPKKMNVFSRVGGEEEEAGGNHWHVFLSRWQAISPDAAKCTSCHPAHITGGSLQEGFMIENTTKAVCEACHEAAR